MLRWARLLIQQTSITVYRLPIKKNKFPYIYIETAAYIYRVGRSIVDNFFADPPPSLLGAVSGKISKIRLAAA